MAITFLASSNNLKVKLPVPGPISKTISVDLISAFSTIEEIIAGFF